MLGVRIPPGLPELPDLKDLEMYKGVAQFLKEVRSELHRIEWPKTREFIGSTMVVLVLVILFALFFFVVDQSIRFGLGKILSWV